MPDGRWRIPISPEKTIDILSSSCERREKIENMLITNAMSSHLHWLLPNRGKESQETLVFPKEETDYQVFLFTLDPSTDYKYHNFAATIQKVDKTNGGYVVVYRIRKYYKLYTVYRATSLWQGSVFEILPRNILEFEATNLFITHLSQIDCSIVVHENVENRSYKVVAR